MTKANFGDPRGAVFGATWAVGVALLVLVLTLVVGAMTALAPVFAAILGVAGALLIFGVLVPLPWLLVLTFLVSAVLAGTAEYFLQIAQANWIPFVLACLIAVRATMEAKFSPGPRESARQSAPNGLPWFAYPAFLYLTVFVASAAANLIPGSQALTASKNYLMMWGVLVAFIAAAPLGRASTWLWRTIVVVGVIQLPIVAFQRLFVSSRLGNSSSSLSFDAINGTFGGGLTGGRSGALAMCICIALAYLLILWRERRIGGMRMIGLGLLLLPTLFIVEVKAVVIWLPTVAFIVFIAQIRQRPFHFFFGVLASVLTVVGVIAAYRYSYYAPGGDRSLEAFFTRDLAYIWDPNRYNPATRELGRMSALVHWWNETRISDLGRVLFGYGPGASRGVSTVAVGAVAARYPFAIDISAAAALLWDLGVVGALAFCAMLLLGAVQAQILKGAARLPGQLRIELEAGMIGLLLILSSVVYVRDSIDGSTVQFMIFFFLGLVIHARRQLVAAPERNRQSASSSLTGSA